MWPKCGSKMDTYHSWLERILGGYSSFWKSLGLLMEVTTTVGIGLKNFVAFFTEYILSKKNLLSLETYPLSYFEKKHPKYVQKSKSKKFLSGLILLQIRKILVTCKSFCKIFAHFLQNFCIFFTKILQNFLKHFFQKKKGTRGHQSLKLQPLLDKKH